MTDRTNNQRRQEALQAVEWAAREIARQTTRIGARLR